MNPQDAIDLGREAVNIALVLGAPVLVAGLEQYGPAILIVLVALPFLTQGSVSILFEIMSPAVNGITRLLAGGDGDVFG